jgi:two-component system, OmpR family, phosphate regulon response regulator PhoB
MAMRVTGLVRTRSQVSRVWACSQGEMAPAGAKGLKGWFRVSMYRIASVSFLASSICATFAPCWRPRRPWCAGSAAPNVLIAENDDVSRLFLADNLEADGYRPVCAADTAEALELLSATLDALIVDVNGDTLGVIDAMREQTCPGIDSHLPILVLTCHTDELRRTGLLDRGADDLLSKPHSYSELRARLNALLRRADARRTPHVLRAGSLRLDVQSRRAWVGEVEIEPLRGKESQLLLMLIAEPERVFTREELLRGVWDSAATPRPARLTRRQARRPTADRRRAVRSQCLGCQQLKAMNQSKA